MNGDVRRVGLAIAWVAVIAVISLGAAGIFGAMAHQPGTPGRAELTYAGDSAIEPGLEAAQKDLADLSASVRRLSDLGRSALGALVAGNVELLDSNVAAGRTLADEIETDAGALSERMALLPGIGPDAALRLSPDVRQRYALIVNAIGATNGLSGAWSRLAVGSVAATRLIGLLQDHDKSTAEAAKFGTAGDYPKALESLTKSDALVADARRLRDQLARTVDVGTLTAWLDLNADYDAALRRLYQALIDSKGKINQEVRDAFAAEKAAAAALPGDTRPLTIILAQIAQGGLNEAVIGIEQARGTLESAVGDLTAPPEESAPPADDGASAPP